VSVANQAHGTPDGVRARPQVRYYKHGTPDGVRARPQVRYYKHGTPDGVRARPQVRYYKHGTPDGVRALSRVRYYKHELLTEFGPVLMFDTINMELLKEFPFSGSINMELLTVSGSIL